MLARMVSIGLTLPQKKKNGVKRKIRMQSLHTGKAIERKDTTPNQRTNEGKKTEQPATHTQNKKKSG